MLSLPLWIFYKVIFILPSKTLYSELMFLYKSGPSIFEALRYDIPTSSPQHFISSTC